MNHRNHAGYIAAAFCGVAIGALACFGQAQQATAQVPAHHPCSVGDWSCVNGKIIALETGLRHNDQEKRHLAESNRQLTAEVERLRAFQAQRSRDAVMDAIWNDRRAVDWWYDRARAEGVK